MAAGASDEADVLESIKAEGRTEGRKEGVEATQRMLLRLMRSQFGDLPPKAVRTVQATKDLGKLEQWADQVMAGHSLDDLGIL